MLLLLLLLVVVTEELQGSRMRGQVQRMMVMVTMATGRSMEGVQHHRGRRSLGRVIAAQGQRLLRRRNHRSHWSGGGGTAVVTGRGRTGRRIVRLLRVQGIGGTGALSLQEIHALVATPFSPPIGKPDILTLVFDLFARLVFQSTKLQLQFHR